MDQIYIEGLKIPARIGVFPWEKQVEQTLYVDIVLELDLGPAGLSDDLADTLNYVSLASTVSELAVARHYQLIEHFAHNVSTALLNDSRIAQVDIKVNKPAAIAHAQKIGVRMIRARDR